MAPSADPIPVLLCIDVEPDEHVYPPENPSPWRGFEVLAGRADHIRRQLADLTGRPARFVWSLRMDPQIAEAYGDPAWVARRYRRILEGFRADGDALGVHPHAWRWDPDHRVWIADHADPRWVARCVEMSFQAFQAGFGTPPDHHRFGSPFVSAAVLELAGRLGARFDLTPEPGEPREGPGHRLGGRWTGDIPDQTDVPRTPYRPDPAAFWRPAPGGDGPLWVIPLSSGTFVPMPRRVRRTLGRVAHPARTFRGMARRLRGPAADRPPGSHHRSLAMWKDWRSPEAFWGSAFASLMHLDRPYLAFAIRSDTGSRPVLGARFDAIMDRLVADPRGKRLVFTTPEDALRRMGLDPRA